MNFLATSIGYGPTLIFLIPCLFLGVAVGIASLIFQMSSHKLANKLWKLQPWTILVTFIVGLSLHIIARFQLRQFSEGSGSQEMDTMNESLEIMQGVDYQFLMIITKGIIFWLACMVIRFVKTNRRVFRSDEPSA
jgi:hypothetical protein